METGKDMPRRRKRNEGVNGGIARFPYNFHISFADKCQAIGTNEA